MVCLTPLRLGSGPWPLTTTWRRPTVTHVNRALAVLTCGAFLTLVLGVLGSGDPVPAMLRPRPAGGRAGTGRGWRLSMQVPA